MQISDMSGIGMTSQRTRVRLIKRLKEQGVRNSRVLQAIESVPRHLFIDEALAHKAYEDTALPIGFQQTISQPLIVARMTELLVQNLDPLARFDKILEIGTGSGYQAAVLSPFAKTLHSVERIRELRQKAAQRIRQLNYRNIYVQQGDGSLGLASKAPYDAIMVTAAPPEIPDQLLEQLKEGGRLVIPVGTNKQQELMLVIREGDEFKREVIDSVRFVPLVPGSVS